jgi:ubiquinone/menaquinone biosynthesis C-methylase UbiE
MDPHGAKQVDATHYDFSRYVGLDRWTSYFHQISEVLRLKPKTLLEVGGGDGVFRSYIKEKSGIAYRSLDIAEDLHPDIVGSVEKIPLPDASVDCVVAFEVLEHIPFDRFPVALAEIARVSGRHAIISLPHFGPPVKFLLKIPFLPEIRFAWKLLFRKAHVWNGEHYWEIGKAGYAPARIKEEIEKHFHIKKEFVPFENQYHHFYILEKRS